MIFILAALLTWALKIIVGTNAGGTVILFVLSLFTVAAFAA